MGNCCSFLKRSKYQSDEKINQIRYNASSLATKEQIVFSDYSTSDNQNKHSKRNSHFPLNLNQQPEDVSLGVPHIADFYPEENSNVPADNPRMNTLFLPKATGDKQKKPMNETFAFSDSSHSNMKPMRKCNSCSTIYVDDSTVSQPHLKWSIRVVSYAIHFHIKQRTADRSIEIFDEKTYPLSTGSTVPVNYNTIIPDHRLIYKFMKNLFTSAQLTSECAIVSLIYLERVLTYAEIDLCPANWKRLLLGSILLASKVWDDQAVWNVDYCQILKDVKVDNMNELERQYLVLMQFNINVPSSVYAKYYFDLRKLDEDSSTYSRKRLTKEKALKLETLSASNNEKIKEYLYIQNMRRTMSASNVKASSCKNYVILS